MLDKVNLQTGALLIVRLTKSQLWIVLLTIIAGKQEYVSFTHSSSLDILLGGIMSKSKYSFELVNTITQKFDRITVLMKV